MTIYFGSSTDEDLIAELEQRGYFCAKAQEPVARVNAYDVNTLDWLDMCDLFDAVGLAEELKAMDELTDERILELAHRKATKYTHAVLVTGGPAFTFSKAHIVDFARAIEKEIRG